MLIVEDHAFIRRLLRDFLRTAYPDATIREAADGASAMEACASSQPKVVLMDINLAGVITILFKVGMYVSVPTDRQWIHNIIEAIRRQAAQTILT